MRDVDFYPNLQKITNSVYKLCKDLFKLRI